MTGYIQLSGWIAGLCWVDMVGGFTLNLNLNSRYISKNQNQGKEYLELEREFSSEGAFQRFNTYGLLRPLATLTKEGICISRTK